MHEAGLLERDDELAGLLAATAAAAAGTGSVVLLHGEAGIGKTSLVRAFRRAVSGSARVHLGACDDLLSPRALGPLRDAAPPGGPLAAALAGRDRDAVFDAVLDLLAAPGPPTVLVVEDAHWADEATLDVLRHVSRRVADLPAVLLVTYRDDEIGAEHELRRLLAAVPPGAVRRVAPRPLSRAAVARLTGADRAAADAVFRLTGGNPFFVTEVAAAGRDAVPATVVDTVLARVRAMDPATQDALEQLSVVPSGAELTLARALFADLTVIAGAERAGVLEVRPSAVAFRHELARRAVEGSLTASRRMALNARILDALLATGQPDLARVVHHAVAAGDARAVAVHAPAAARAAEAAGALRQAAALYGRALEHPALLAPDDRAAALEQLAWAQFHTHRLDEAVASAAAAVELRRELGEDLALGRALSTAAITEWAALRPGRGVRSAEASVALLRPAGDSFPLVFALTSLAVVLINLDRDRAGFEAVDDALRTGERIGDPTLRAAGLQYRGRARWQRGDVEGGRAELREGLELARAHGQHEDVVRGYTNLVSLLWRSGRFPELAEELDAAARAGEDRDFPTHQRAADCVRCQLLALRGEWAAAEEGLGWVLTDPAGGGALGQPALPTLALLAVRRGDEGAPRLLAAAREQADRAQALPALVVVAAAEAEHALLTGDLARAGAARALLERLREPGRERWRGELLRHLARVGDDVVPFDGCPEEFAAGLRGDWRAAADAWLRVGAPYERAMELADSGEVDPTLEALAVLDGLGARPAAALVRRRLRELGVRQVPRGPQPATRSNPAGLTARQVEILRLLAGGATNAEIAAALVLSVRTVDHHVSAVLQKLGVATRREAAAAAAHLLAS